MLGLIYEFSVVFSICIAILLLIKCVASEEDTSVTILKFWFALIASFIPVLNVPIAVVIMRSIIEEKY